MTNYSHIRNLGIQYLEQMNGRTWTDFNAHDPGITILETLCYALTDIEYRTEHDIVDLLADAGSHPHDSLHHPAVLLTSHAVTHNDLRRLLLDVVGVKNAWIENVEERLDNHEPLVGLYRIVIEASPERDGVLIRRDIGKRLHKHRGLCEDFTDIVLLDPLHITVTAKVEIGRVDNPATTYAAILDAIDEVISPTLRFSSPAERIATGLPIDEIFDGPLLDHGFITDDAIAEPRHRAIHTSDIIRAVMDIPGVRTITEVVLAAGDTKTAWSLDVPLDRSPHFQRQLSHIELLNAGLRVAIGATPKAPAFPKRMAMGNDASVALPTGRNRNVARYHSVQHHFPMIYGIGEAGLSPTETSERKALAKQLAAFLMFFDQLLANHLAQLAQCKNLFSIHPTATNRTYFTQMVDEPTLDLQTIAHAKQADLDALVETPDQALARKDRFLNHLLARFAEHLNDRYSASDSDAAHATVALIRQKQAFLEQYPRISGSRGTAFDALGPWGKANPSGLEERIRFKLGLVEANVEASDESMIMIEHVLMRPGQLHRFDWFLDWLPAPTDVRDPYSLRITFVFPKFRGRFANADFRQIVEHTVRNQTPAHIGTYVLWLDAATCPKPADWEIAKPWDDDAAWKTFHQNHTEWRRRRREHIALKLGISLGLDTRLLTYVDNLDDLPGLTLPTISSACLARHGDTAQVVVHGSQEGNAEYSLVREADGASVSSISTLGTGKTITIDSIPLTEDLVLRVQVERLFDDTIWLDAPLPVRVRANPALPVTAADGTHVESYGDTIAVTVANSQASVSYRAHTRRLTDEDFFCPPSPDDVIAPLPSIDGIADASTAWVAPPPDKAWESVDYVADAAAEQGNGGALVVDAGTMEEDMLVIVRAHKEHGADPPDATDVQLKQAVLLLIRPDENVPLTLTKTSDTTITVTRGEPGVLYYLLDPTTNELLGKPAYFHRKRNATTNRGIGGMRIGHDWVIATGVVAPGAYRATTEPLDPVVTVSAIPATHTVHVMAVRARTGAAWTTPQTKSVVTI